ncbi:MAG: hypothetical protein ACI945_001155, partial [Pseudohongiellaceae bacterium]
MSGVYCHESVILLGRGNSYHFYGSGHCAEQYRPRAYLPHFVTVIDSG